MSDISPSSEMTAVIAELQANGAERFEPVRFAYIEAMLKRAISHRAPVAQAIEKKAQQALREYQADFERARNQAALTVEQVTAHYPAAADNVCRYFEIADFKSVKRLAVALDRNDPATLFAALIERIQHNKTEGVEPEGKASLDDVLRKLETQALQSFGDSSVTSTDTRDDRPELKSFRMFRDYWVKHNAEKILQQAINSAPENAGPLNPEMLTIRSLIALRDLSPEYTNRLICYLDTLLWLDKANEATMANLPKKTRGKVKYQGLQ